MPAGDAKIKMCRDMPCFIQGCTDMLAFVGFECGSCIRYASVSYGVEVVCSTVRTCFDCFTAYLMQFACLTAV